MISHQWKPLRAPCWFDTSCGGIGHSGAPHLEQGPTLPLTLDACPSRCWVVDRAAYFLSLFSSLLLHQARGEAKEQLIKGSIIAADQTMFPYPIDSFPPLANSEVK